MKNVNIFYKSIINRWLVGFTKPKIDYEILAVTQHWCVLALWLYADM